MSSMQLYSEPFARTGNIAAEGSKRLLGRPALGQLQTFVREGIQNCLDAGLGNAAVDVLVRLRTLTSAQHKALGELVLAKRPHDSVARSRIDTALEKSDLKVLELCDFGTEGLSGPTRADIANEGEEPLNFVNFVRNIGAGRDVQNGGGTYGYGKSSFYAMSSCSTIVMDTQTRYGGHDQRRLMACHLGSAFEAAGNDGRRLRFTGRHWWGVLDGDNSVEPATGDMAERIAEALGLPPRNSGRTGTSLFVIDPTMEDDDPQVGIDSIVETILWNFWPRMVASTPINRTLKVAVELEGKPVQIPAPEDFPPLDLFAAAMEKYRTCADDVRPIFYGRQKKVLGNLVMRRGLCGDRSGPALRDGSVIPRNASHIALMRPVELVVRYMQGEPCQDSRYEWAGVFICSDDADVEQAFAQAEPPAHDDWIPDNLPKGSAKSYVRVALRRINEAANPGLVQPVLPKSQEDKGLSLAETASRLGTFLDKTTTTGPGRPSRRPSGARAAKALAISPVRFGGLELDPQGRPLARFVAELRNDGSDDGLSVVAQPYLVADGSNAGDSDLPSGLIPRVVRMMLRGVYDCVGSASLVVGRESGTLEVFVPTVRDAAVAVKLELRAGDGS